MCAMNEAIDVRTLRQSLGLSQRQLAELLGIDRSSVAHIESGREPRGSTRILIEQLARGELKRPAACQTNVGTPARP